MGNTAGRVWIDGVDGPGFAGASLAKSPEAAVHPSAPWILMALHVEQRRAIRISLCLRVSL